MCFQFSCSVVSNSLWPHGLQNARPPSPSPTPRAYSNSCPSSQRCHPTISSSVIPFSFRLQSFPSSESFQMSQFFTSGGPRIGVSASASVLPMNIQGWFPLGLAGLISLQSRGFFMSLLQNYNLKASILWHSAFFMVQLSHLYMATRKAEHDYWEKNSWIIEFSNLLNWILFFNSGEGPREVQL